MKSTWCLPARAEEQNLADELVIETEGLTKRFGDYVAVDNLSMEVRRGHVYGLLGPNGSGKTTTMGMLLGLLRPTAGRYRLLGWERGGGDALSRVGAVIESPSMYPYLTGRQNLAYFQRITGRSSQADLDSLLKRVGLAGHADGKFRTFSLGMKQRLGIAYALMGDPDLVFLDEPTNGLDPEGMIEVRELIRSLGDGDRTVLLSSHLLNEVEQVCDSVTIIARGKLIAQGSVSELIGAGRREQVRLKTTDDDRALQILAALDWVAEVVSRDDGMVVTAPIERSGDLTATLADLQVYVTEMGPVRTSLEDYFLEVTHENQGGLGC